jgi:Na+/proline symporter
MLIWFVILYWIISVGIGLWAAKRVKNTGDYAVAGRSLPLAMVTTTVFATWFGSEAVLGIPASFLKDGFSGIVADPFGSSLCLVLVGLFFAIPLYRMNLLTIGDYYRERYGRKVELVTSLCVVLSYLGWVAAQITALGLVFNVVSDGSVSREMGMCIGAASILAYTLFGGMWSVAVTDFVQMIIIVIGMIYIAFVVGGLAGGPGVVIHHAAADGKFHMLPAANPKDVLAFVAAGITLMLGSIPQQDVFQRVASSKNEQTARNASVLGGVLYFLFAFIPMFLAYSATLISPDMVKQWMDKDSQMILPNLVLQNVNVVAQVMFFGALLSAIKSCASATLLAPSVTFAENVLKGFLPKINDKQYLLMMRAVVLVFTTLVTAYAWYSQQQGATIYSMVENAYKVTLVATFVPLACGLYWRRATNIGAMVSIALGLFSWIGMEMLVAGWWFTFLPMPAAIASLKDTWPPELVGLLLACIGMVTGSLLSAPHEKPLTHHHAHEFGARNREAAASGTMAH